MSDSIKKWEELQDAEKERQRVIAQNGNSALHYDHSDEDIELAPLKNSSTSILPDAEIESNQQYKLEFVDGVLVNRGFVSTSTSTDTLTVASNSNETYEHFDRLTTDSNPTYTGWTPGCPIHHVEEESEEFIEDPKEDKFGTILESIKVLLDYKNEKYGNAALEPMNIFQGKCKVGQRLDDKLARVKNAENLKKNDVADLIGYLTLVCVENGWDNFDEFKD